MYSQIKDGLGRSVNQVITAATFCETIPPKYDVENTNEDVNANQESLYNQNLNKYSQDLVQRFLVLGLSKGVVLFLHVDKIDQIYSRFFFHK